MGQWIVIQGASSEDAAELSERALQAYFTLHRLEPSDRVAEGATHAYTFAPRFSPGLRIESSPETGEWAGGAGPLFYEDSGRQEALRHFVGADLERAVGRLDGAFAIFRRIRNGEIAVITDRLGTMHAYAVTLRSATVISTSSMVLAALCEANWDLVSCREFLATGTVFGQRTLFQEIEKLAPGSIYRFEHGRLKSKTPYWRIADFEYGSLGASDTTRRLASALQRVMRKIVGSYPRPLLDLTGGLDSRAVLGATLKGRASFETTVAGKDCDADALVSSSIARQYEIVHHRIDPPSEVTMDEARALLSLTDGEYDLFEYARIARIHSCSAQNHDVSVNGASGEICRGHWWEKLFPFTGSRRWFPTNIVAAQCFAGRPQAELLATVFPLTRRWQGRIASATNRLWPAISPFACRDPLELALTAAPRIRIRGRLSRRLITHLDPKLAAFPWRHKGPAAQSTGEVRAWNEIRDLLTSPHAASTALYSPGALTGLMDRAWGTRLPRTAIARVVTLELLARALKESRID
jgi:hypothetical protein